MDQGMIKSLKAHYRTLSVQKLIDSIEKKKPHPEFFILDTMQTLDVAWGKVKTEAIYKCFSKAGISECADAMLVADDPLRISRTSFSVKEVLP